MSRPAPKLLLGIGNLLLGDDGVGVVALRRMAALRWPPDVELFEGGTAGMALAPTLEQRELVVVIDALAAGDPPGTIRRLDPEKLRTVSTAKLSVHDLHLLDALAETQLVGRAPRRVVVFGIQVADTSLGIGLSPAVERAVGRVIALARRELGFGAEPAGMQSVGHPVAQGAPGPREIISCN